MSIGAPGGTWAKFRYRLCGRPTPVTFQSSDLATYREIEANPGRYELE